MYKGNKDRGRDLRVIPGHTCSGDTADIDP